MKKALLFLLALVLCVSFAGCIDLEGDPSGDGGNENPGGTTDNAIKAGTYHVGEDLDAGEYYLVKDGGFPTFEVTLTKGALMSSDDYLYGKMSFASRYVQLEDGQYIKFSSAKMYKIADAPAAAKDTDNGYKPGQLKCGRDLDAGEYVIADPQRALLSTVSVLAVPNAEVTSEHTLFFENYIYRKYVTLQEGQYVDFNNGKLYKIGDAPAAVKDSDKGYGTGQYRCGTDFPAGDYIIVDSTLSDLAVLELRRTPNAEISTEDYLFIENYVYRQYVTLEEGQYLNFSKGKLYLVSDAPKIQKNTDGSFKNGQYKVGTDILPGVYMLTPAAGKAGYYEIGTLPLYEISSGAFVDNEAFPQAVTVTLTAGQYIKVKMCAGFTKV